MERRPEPSPPSQGIRFLFLLLTCSGAAGLYFGYNIIGATATVLKRPPINFTEYHIGWLMSAYSLPNWFMPFFGGYICDKWGTHTASALFSGLVLLGSVMILNALSWTHVSTSARFYGVLTGMAIFGVGGESLTIAQKAMLSVWFSESLQFPQFAFACGFSLTFAYSSTIACRLLAPWLVRHSLVAAYAVPTSVSAISLLCTLVACGLYRYHTAWYCRSQQLNFPHVSIAASIRTLPWAMHLAAWMLAFSAGLYACNETFWPDVLVVNWGYHLGAADRLHSLTCLIALILIPLFGHCFDVRGGHLSGAIGGCAVLAFSWMACCSPALRGIAVTPILATVGVAVGASLLFSSLWALPPLVVPRSQVGLAFGVMTAVQNLVLSMELPMAGFLHDATGGFDATGRFLAFTALASCAIGVVLVWTGALQYHHPDEAVRVALLGRGVGRQNRPATLSSIPWSMKSASVGSRKFQSDEACGA